MPNDKASEYQRLLCVLCVSVVQLRLNRDEKSQPDGARITALRDEHSPTSHQKKAGNGPLAVPSSDKTPPQNSNVLRSDQVVDAGMRTWATVPSGLSWIGISELFANRL